MKTCVNCGESIPDDVKTCPYCGHIFESDYIADPIFEDSPKTVDKNSPTLAIMLAVFAIAFLVEAFVYFAI